jgi:ABC-type transport system substrate-binding protein
MARGLIDANLKAKLASADPLTLKYPKGEKDVAPAMEAIKKQLMETLGLNIELEELEPRVLHERVEAGTYNLAYYHYDFPSEAYWLWPLFHPSGNILGYLNDADLDSLFRNAMSRRDFVKVQELTHLIHNYIHDHMLIIPLWQLASYIAIRDTYATPALDPLHVLCDVEHWTLRGKR